MLKQVYEIVLMGATDILINTWSFPRHLPLLPELPAIGANNRLPETWSRKRRCHVAPHASPST